MKLIACFLPLYLVSTVLYSDEHCLICKKNLASNDKKVLLCQHTFHESCYDVLAEHGHVDCPKCSGFIDEPYNGALHLIHSCSTNSLIQSLTASVQQTNSELELVRNELRQEKTQLDNLTIGLCSMFIFGVVVLYCVRR
ncbi:RING finger domain-containing protein [Endozoicomonas sp. 8E]|uniref:RING finger domain-containing protein n=1 Tax=Endozoicomonas sp. 8E TaxID=3035692 RepID=UPI002939475E|nr:RING finger domain-containing protein [Endozoicomonas sp. 8E]WOG28131.1 RING finger domain-containing protein [Endozoicomonas sp. 8E]